MSEFQFGYPEQCSMCNDLSNHGILKVKPYYRPMGSHRLLLIGQDPTIRKFPERVKHVLMLDDPKSQLSKWLKDLFGASNFNTATLYGTNIVKCTFTDLPSNQGGFNFLKPFFQKCKKYLIKEILNYKPDLVLTFGEAAHKSFISILDSQSEIDKRMKDAFTGSFVLVEIKGIKFEYSPCLHIQTYRVAEKYGDKVKDFKKAMKSSQGHEIATRVIAIIEEIKKNTIDIHTEQSKLDKELEHRLKARHQWLQGIVFVVAILAVSILTYLGKFDSTLGLLFGTLVGFFFGKKANA